MDWAWLYGTLIRSAGWTFDQCGEQPADRVFEFLSHLAEYPTADALMRARYGIKPPKRKTAKPRAKKATEQNQAEFREMQTYLGAALPLTPHLRGLVDWANAQDERMSASHRP
jgi:hypothetical protein